MSPTNRTPSRALAAALICAFIGGAPLISKAQSAASESTPKVANSTLAFSAVRVGRGRPMILIPGLLSGGEVWNGAVERYRHRFDMHVLTLAGFAGVPALPTDKYLEAERDAIIRYIRENRLERPVLVGHSLGAFLAFWVAATAPDLVGPIIAVDGVPYLPSLGDTSMTPAKAMGQATRFSAMAATFSSEQMGMQSAMAMRAQSRDSSHTVMAARWGRTSDGATMGRAMAEMLTTDLRAEVAAIRTPVLLIASGFDFTDDRRNLVLASYAAQVSRIPDRRVVMAKNARHFVMLDDPTYLYSMIDEFLSTR
ncbi:MAG: alpha/beta hydrolase [Gemmatimonadaceae bacterium]